MTFKEYTGEYNDTVILSTPCYQSLEEAAAQNQPDSPMAIITGYKDPGY